MRTVNSQGLHTTASPTPTPSCALLTMSISAWVDLTNTETTWKESKSKKPQRAFHGQVTGLLHA